MRMSLSSDNNGLVFLIVFAQMLLSFIKHFKLIMYLSILEILFCGPNYQIMVSIIKYVSSMKHISDHIKEKLKRF